MGIHLGISSILLNWITLINSFYDKISIRFTGSKTKNILMSQLIWIQPLREELNASKICNKYQGPSFVLSKSTFIDCTEIYTLSKLFFRYFTHFSGTTILRYLRYTSSWMLPSIDILKKESSFESRSSNPVNLVFV